MELLILDWKGNVLKKKKSMSKYFNLKYHSISMSYVVHQSVGNVFNISTNCCKTSKTTSFEVFVKIKSVSYHWAILYISYRVSKTNTKISYS